MNNKTIIKKMLLFAIFLATTGLWAQTYHPITNNCTWSVSNEKYMTAGDTLLNGKTYLKIYYQKGNQPFEFSLENADFFAAIRNDSAEKKVYAYLPAGTWVYDIIHYSYTQTSTDMEVTIYDFSLKIGDTVTYYTLGDQVVKNRAIRTETANITIGWGEYSPVNHQYSEGDSLVTFSDNGSRSQLFLQGLSNPAIYNVWIESIGSIRGFNETPQLLSSDYGYRTLLCFDNHSGTSFHTEFDLDNDPDDCFSNGFGGDVPERMEKTAKVYPNPADDILYVELSGAGIANITLYDLQGRAVGANHDSPLQGIATLNVRNVPAGVYVLRVTDVNGKEYLQKIVIK